MHMSLLSTFGLDRIRLTLHTRGKDLTTKSLRETLRFLHQTKSRTLSLEDDYLSLGGSV